MANRGGESVPQHMRAMFDAVVGITDAFCRQHLNDEYAGVCRALAAALSRKRPSPLAKGQLQPWACGIVYTVGTVNFLFDKTQTPHMTTDQLCELFGVGKSTAAAKRKAIELALNVGPLDPCWCLPSKLADNPLAWMIEVNGFLIDARHAPREIQEEAFRRGLIPYLPLAT